MQDLWVETVSGGDFMTLARKKIPHGASLVRVFPADDMAPGLKTPLPAGQG